MWPFHQHLRVPRPSGHFLSRSPAFLVLWTGVDRWSRKLFSVFHVWKNISTKKKRWTQIGEILHMHYSVSKWKSIFRQNAPTGKNRGILFHGQFCICEEYNVSVSCALIRFSRANIFENQQKCFSRSLFQGFQSFFMSAKICIGQNFFFHAK